MQAHIYAIKTLIIRIYAQCRHDNDRREEVNEER